MSPQLESAEEIARAQAAEQVQSQVEVLEAENAELREKLDRAQNERRTEAELTDAATDRRLAEEERVDKLQAECEGLREKLDKLREVVELECDDLATLATGLEGKNVRECIGASESRLLAAARAAALHVEGTP